MLLCYCAASCYLLQQPLFAIAALHAQGYVDHSTVTVLAENQTAITVWFHPSSANSTGLGLFQRSSSSNGRSTGAATGPTLATMEVWQLKALPSTL